MICKIRYIIIFTLIPFFSFAQQGEISGKIMNEKGEFLSGVHINIFRINKNTVSDSLGAFKVEDLKPGKYNLFLSHIGYKNTVKEINISKQDHKIILEFYLKEEFNKLNDVTITSKSKAQKLRESVANVSILTTKELYTKNNNTSDVVKQISGVNVRQSGGFGSDTEIFINGMSGKQIKFFFDGIPLSYYGSGLGINVIPINLMKQIEVYKGFVPIDFGADALGGAINVVPRKNYKDYLDISYSFGSFNTHKINANGQYVNNKFKLGINSFYNYSDNNYEIDVEIPDKSGNPVPTKVRRFHDKFSNYLFNAYTGLYNTDYADKLQLDVRYSSLKDDIQHNAIMSQPYGEAIYKENTFGTSITYEKQEILKRTNLKWFGGFSLIKGYFKDVSKNNYTWDGKIYSTKASGAELSSSGNLLDLTSQNFVSRVNIKHVFSENGKLIFNNLNSIFNRKGKDPIAAEFYGKDYYSNPIKLIKSATGLAYEHEFFNKLTSYTGLKYFMFDASGYTIENLVYLPNKQSVSNIGYLQSFKYQFHENFLLKTSYEYATRLPDELELFGDFMLAKPNPFLKPEQSHNVNLGWQWNTKKVKFDVNTFYRLTNNVIWLRTSQFFAQYQNLLKSVTKGIETEITYKPYSFLRFKLNTTFQDIRNRSPKSITQNLNDRYYNARLPNKPYLFGNVEIHYQTKNFLNTKNRFSAWWNTNYVNEYFLFWEVDGNKNSKKNISTQLVQNSGLTYTFKKDLFSVTFEGTNILNQKVFDNFSVQRPGRAFYITLRTFLK